MSNIKIGQKAEVISSFYEDDVINYVNVSRDTNPIHTNHKYARMTDFNGRIVPGMLVASLFGGLLGSELPGKGTILLGQTLYFKNPLYLGHKVRAVIKVTNIRKDKPIITFETICYNMDNEILIDGEAVVKLL